LLRKYTEEEEPGEKSWRKLRKVVVFWKLRREDAWRGVGGGGRVVFHSLPNRWKFIQWKKLA
jgi:hypothetical protein